LRCCGCRGEFSRGSLGGRKRGAMNRGWWSHRGRGKHLKERRFPGRSGGGKGDLETERAAKKRSRIKTAKGKSGTGAKKRPRGHETQSK